MSVPIRPDAYDDFWDLYEAWCDSVPPSAKADAPFYAARYAETDGVVCELGAGDGRVVVPALERGARVVAVEGSGKMIERLVARAEGAGVADRLTTVRADMRSFELSEPVDLVAIPFHSIGHMVSMDDKRACLARVHAALKPGGRFIFDHFVPNPAIVARSRAMTFRSEYVSPITGRRGLIFASTAHDLPIQHMRVYVRSDELDDTGLVVETRYRTLDFSWIEPEQSRELLESSGFEIETCYGDFEGSPFGDGSHHQVWVARRPGS